MTSAGVTERLKNIRTRNGKFIVIDPRETETAKVASEHHFITPATDVYFLLSFLHILYRDGRKNIDELAEHIKGEHLLSDLVKPFTPSAVAPIIGMKASTIERLVAEFCAQDKAVIYGRMGLSTQPHGGLNNWLLNTINIISGNFDRAGGMMFPSPAIELARDKNQPDTASRWKSRVRGLDEFYGELPVSTMVDEFDPVSDKKVRGFLTICGNPVLSTPSGGKLEPLLPDLDFMFSIDNYINETTRHANIVLPTPSGLEVDHYDMIFHTISVSNNVKYSEALFPAETDRPYDWQVLKELIRRVSKNKLDLYTRLATPRRVVNWGLMLGPYGKLSHPKRWFSGLSLKKVIKSKHGIRLGPMMPRVPDGLITSDRKINIAPRNYVERLKDVTEGEFAELSKSLESAQEDELRLIGRRHVNTNNSWMHQFQKLSRSKMVRCTAMINPDDASRLKIGDGDDIQVSTRIGEIRLPAEVTDAMMVGTICIPHGFGHHRPGTRVPIASEKAGVSVNDITDHNLIDPLTGNAAFSGQIVKVKALVEMREVEMVTGKPVTILYGSRTGNSEALAMDVARKAEQFEMVANVYAMDEFEKDALADQERLLIICSTYGEGDMPDNAQGLWEQVDQGDLDLSGVNYSVLALGDSAYETFCQAGKDWDRRLEEQGATRISERIDSDVDYTPFAEGWTQTVLPLTTLTGDQSVKMTQPSNAGALGPPGTNRNNPISLVLKDKRKLTAAGSTKETFHYRLCALGVEQLYETGGILNIFPKNEPALVQALAKELKLNLKLRKNEELKQKLSEHYDLRSPSIDLMKMAGIENASEIEGKDVLDVLKSIPPQSRSFDKFLTCLRPMIPRSYSIASSPNQRPDCVDLCVATVRYVLGNRNYNGAGSTYLQDRVEEGDEVLGYFVKNNGFTLPVNRDQPVIMIGPGTGLAPFRGFLQEHSIQNYTSPTWLFFGERNEATDFLYQDEMKGFLSSGTLSRLNVAFSRDQAEKIYVQNLMQQNGEEFYKWLENGASVYVCGDAKNMANDVDLALRDILKTHGNMKNDEVETYVEDMKRQQRYVRDVY